MWSFYMHSSFLQQSIEMFYTLNGDFKFEVSVCVTEPMD